MAPQSQRCFGVFDHGDRVFKANGAKYCWNPAHDRKKGPPDCRNGENPSFIGPETGGAPRSSRGLVPLQGLLSQGP